MSSTKSFIIFAFICMAMDQCTPKIPSFLKLCHRNDPHLDKCVKHSIESLKPHLRSGIAALHIPRCEPLKIKKINVTQSVSAIAIKAVYTNILVKESTKFFVKNVKVDIDNDRIQLKFFFPHLSITSDYDINGKILMIPIIGNSKAQGNFTDIDAEILIRGLKHRKREDQRIYLSVNDVNVKFTIGHGSVYFDDLFNGNKILSEGINAFLNKNWEIISTDMKPMLENIIQSIFKDFSNNIFSTYPLDELLLP